MAVRPSGRRIRHKEAKSDQPTKVVCTLPDNDSRTLSGGFLAAVLAQVRERDAGIRSPPKD